MKKLYTIGRDLQNDIVIDDDSDVISRLHATIRFDGSKMYLIDQSQNGTYVNGMRMTANEEVPVSRKDNVSFANVSDLDWNLLPDPAKTKMRFMWIGIVSVLALLFIGWAVLHFTSTNQVKESEEPQKEIPANYDMSEEKEVDGAGTNEDSTSVVSEPIEETNEVSTKNDDKNKKSKGNKTDKDSKPDKVKDEPKTEGVIPLY